MSGPRERPAPHPGRRLRLSLEKTRGLLDSVAGACTPEFLDTDPLGVVREWDGPGDREIAGLLALGLAYGRVVAIRRSALSRLGILGLLPERGAAARPGRWVAALGA